MLRRQALKNMALVSTTLITLPWWMGCGPADKPLTHSTSFSAKEQELLASLTDTIIPPGAAIGALSMGVDKFLQKLLDDCYEKPVQDNVKTQLKVLAESAKSAHGKTFSQCTPEQRAALFQQFSSAKDPQAQEFFKLLRSETIRGFVTSREVMEKYHHYKIAPGHYQGCVDVKA
jgi:hypothetical protein